MNMWMEEKLLLKNWWMDVCLHPNVGQEYGAKFILNIEQYEHVVGYSSGEGVKVTH